MRTPTAREIAMAQAIISDRARRAGATKSPARAAASRRNLEIARAKRKRRQTPKGGL